MALMMHVVLIIVWIYLQQLGKVPVEGKNPEIKSIREKRRINPNKTCSGSVVETGDGFRQREICMTEWGILEEGAHK